MRTFLPMLFRDNLSYLSNVLNNTGLGYSSSNENPKETVAFTLRSELPDVCVHTPMAKYLVHSEVLKICSPWFAASMSETWFNEQLESKPGAAAGSSFKYNYYFNTDEDGIHMLLSVDKGSASRAGWSTSWVGWATSWAGWSTRDAECAALGNIFRAFYRKPLVLETPIDSKNVLYLIETAEKYDALDICTPPILGALFEIENFDKEVSLHSARYLLIGHKLKSTLLFRDAFIHVAGQWHVDSFRNNKNHPTFPEPVRKLVEAENTRIMEIITATMRSLLSVKAGTWMITCGLAKVLVLLTVNDAFNTFPKNGDEGSLFNYIYNPPKKFAPVYEGVGTHNAFCTRGTLCEVHHGYSRYDNAVLRRQATSFLTSTVKALVKNNTRLNTQHPYLTCAELSDDQMPWLE